MVRNGLQEFVNDTDGTAFLERELMVLGGMGIGRSEFTLVKQVRCSQNV